jgi:hypothetical protein
MLVIHKGVNLTRLEQDLLHAFITFALDYLNTDCPKVISIVSDRKNANIRTTANFSPSNHAIKVLGKGRALPDIFRSCAHELVHFKQMLTGELDKYPHTDVGGYLEDRAASGAAEMLKAFSYVFPPDVIYRPRQ